MKSMITGKYLLKLLGKTAGLILAVLLTSGIYNLNAEAGAQTTSTVSQKKTVSCIGDSITYGTGVEQTRDTQSYPALLNLVLGSDWEVNNFGVWGAAVQTNGEIPYAGTKEFAQSLMTPSDIILIMLGTNDAKYYAWNAARYEAELTAYVEAYRVAQPGAKIYLMTCPHVYVEEGHSEVNFEMEEELIEAAANIIRKVAAKMEVGLIDQYAMTAGHPEWYVDGVHPNAVGDTAMAAYIFQNIQ